MLTFALKLRLGLESALGLSLGLVGINTFEIADLRNSSGPESLLQLLLLLLFLARLITADRP